MKRKARGSELQGVKDSVPLVLKMKEDGVVWRLAYSQTFGRGIDEVEGRVFRGKTGPLRHFAEQHRAKVPLFFFAETEGFF